MDNTQTLRIKKKSASRNWYFVRNSNDHLLSPFLTIGYCMYSTSKTCNFHHSEHNQKDHFTSYKTWGMNLFETQCMQCSVCTNAGKLLISSLTLANALLLFRKKGALHVL